MRARERAASVRQMAAKLLHGSDPLRVVIAGGGVAALETLIGLSATAATRLALTLVAPGEQFIYRPLEVGEPFGLGSPRRYDLADLAGDFGARVLRDALARVRPEERVALLASGDEVPYDALVVAVGARPVPAFEHGVVFDREHEGAAFDEVLADVSVGLVSDVAVVVPPGVTWTLPAYELALMTAAWGRASWRHRVRVTLVTGEEAPLDAFGAPVSRAVAAIAATGGVDVLTGIDADVVSDTTLRLGGGAGLLVADRIVALPAPAGPRITGLPADGEGFIHADEHGRVPSLERVYAAGDGTTHPVKQGGLAAQQADAVVEHLAAAAGAELVPRPYRPVLRGLLRTQDGPRYLRAELGDVEATSAISAHPLWWPPSKIASIWLSPHLARREVARAAAPQALETGGIAWQSTAR